MKNMRRWRKALRKRKLNNKAMTLIEVVVAMAILAVVITPTLRMLASSSSTNLQSRNRQRATTVGESVMENFKAYTMQKLCSDFDNHSLYNTYGTTETDVQAYYASDPATPNDRWSHKNYTLDQDAVKYHFTIDNAVYENTKYNIDIWATPKSKPEVISFESQNAYSDAIIELQETIIKEDGGVLTVTDVIDLLKEKAKNSYLSSHADYTIDQVTLSKMKRVINIDVNDDGHFQTVTEEISYSCEAKIDFHKPSGLVGVPPVAGSDNITDPTIMTYTVEYDDGAGGTVTTRKVYDNSATIGDKKLNNKQCKLNNVYLYYFPAYEKIYGDSPEDEINITGHLTDLYKGDGTDPKGEGQEPLRVIIARQLSTLLSDTELTTEEENYKYKVNGSITGGKVILLHNFGEKLKEKPNHTPTTASGHITGFPDPDNNVMLIKKGIVEKINLIYDLKVEVYEGKTGRTNLLAEYTGTKNE